MSDLPESVKQGSDVALAGFLEELRASTSYNPDTGELIWISPPHYKSGRRVDGKRIVGSLRKDGYLRAKIRDKYYMVHRVIWLIVYGCWPAGQIDHINGIKNDNRLINLRDVPHYGNCQNTCNRTTNRSGVQGVSIRNGRFVARFRSNGRAISVGSFSTLEEAEDAVIKARMAEQEYFVGRAYL